MQKRIKMIRESLGLSQREFGEKIGVSRDVISNIEYNRAPAKDLLIKHICEQYHINETWLRTGNGQMFTDQLPNKKTDEAIRIFQSLRPEFQDFALQQIKLLAEFQEKII